MTTSLKPRPKYKQRTITKTKTMTEQKPPSLETLTKVQSHLPDVQLIDRIALWEDFTNRITETHKLASPYVNKAVTKVKDFRSNLSS